MSKPKILVRAMHRRSRRQWVIRWPGGERIAKEQTPGGAWREAVEYEQRLNNPTHKILEWRLAAASYEEWHLQQHSEDHRAAWATARRRFELFCGGQPPDVPEITNQLLAEFAATVGRQVSGETVRTYCRYLRGFFRWCVEQEWIDRAPQIRLPRRKRGESRSRGRPITAEEFERMLAAVPDVVGEGHAESWRFVLRGLWESSLRLREAVTLHWTQQPITIDAAGQYPMIVFAHGDKGGHKRLPVTPALWAMLQSQPHRGYVFRPVLSKGVSRSRETWCQRISQIGRRAGVIVNQTGKCATAHDLRRSFLQRWRAKVDSAVLQILARHESITTTEQYYLADDAERVAAAIWDER